jgi:hypothetical protein
VKPKLKLGECRFAPRWQWYFCPEEWTSKDGRHILDWENLKWWRKIILRFRYGVKPSTLPSFKKYDPWSRARERCRED